PHPPLCAARARPCATRRGPERVHGRRACARAQAKKIKPDEMTAYTTEDASPDDIAATDESIGEMERGS
ncbi:hypothetical protein LEMLEM_LOCUS6222, partial [Lemmus lemmus]